MPAPTPTAYTSAVSPNSSSAEANVRSEPRRCRIVWSTASAVRNASFETGTALHRRSPLVKRTSPCRVHPRNGRLGGPSTAVSWTARTEAGPRGDSADRANKPVPFHGSTLSGRREYTRVSRAGSAGPDPSRFRPDRRDPRSHDRDVETQRSKRSVLSTQTNDRLDSATDESRVYAVCVLTDAGSLRRRVVGRRRHGARGTDGSPTAHGTGRLTSGFRS